MLVLGVDPGTAIVGFGVVRQEGQRLSAVDYGAIRTTAGAASAERLRQIFADLTRLLEEHRPDYLAVERLFFNRNTTTAMAVGQARGVVLLAAAQRGIPVAEYTPQEIKQAVTGGGRASKGQVGYMVRTLLDLPTVPAPDDVCDALAVAICHCNFCTAGERGLAVRD
ncbi:MAG: crossover junction endodeoxyribonuclease RuvC [Bacillota bacterium]|nr:crossover junction endodeoxyribonuclease RuvC [Bacillota bacterium]